MVMARLDIEVFVDCPNCEYFIDLLRPSDTNDYDHNEEGYILNQACPDGHWTEAHERFEVEGVTCSKCSHTFDVKGLEW